MPQEPREQSMHIIGLETENVKRIKAAAITPSGNLVVVGGNNGQGKSSLLDSIMMALCGGKSLCQRPLREGATKGRVTIDLGEYRVTRTFTPRAVVLDASFPGLPRGGRSRGLAR